MFRKTVSKYINKETLPKHIRVIKKHGKLNLYTNYIDERLNKNNISALRIFEEIKTQGYTGKYGSTASYVSKFKKENKNKAILRFETLPCEQAQVDWGYLGKIYDEKQKKMGIF